MKNSKKWCCWMLVLTVLVLSAAGALTAVIDPFFHYHAPLPFLSYPLSEQRYQNDGIVRHFSYDAIITGTSMTENFLASEMNALFDVNAVKVNFSGAGLREINENLERAFAANPDIRMVVRSLDGYMLAADTNEMFEDEDYPEYLYDDSLLNDVSYVLNKEILLNHTMKVLQYTLAGLPSTSFDDYSYWADQMTFGADEVWRYCDWEGAPAEPTPLTEHEKQRLIDNLEQNVLAMARQNPQTDFYLFFPPYSVPAWYDLYHSGRLERQIEIYELTTRLLLECENIHLFSFHTEYEYTADLSHYMDPEHYDADMNSQILRNMRDGVNLLTKENDQAHWSEVEEYYSSFDYEAYFLQYGYNVT